MINFHGAPVSYNETGSFDKLIVDYLNKDQFLSNFYSFANSEEGLKQSFENYVNPRLDRELLKKTLLNQYALDGIKVLPEKVRKNIEFLSFEKTFTVSTGHQLSVFGGPLYVLYKILSAINTTEALTKNFPGYNFVPVFWMATEDHDIEEISSISLFGKKYTWQNTWKGVSGKMPLTGMTELIHELKQTFGNSVFSDELTKLLDETYLSSKTLAEATRKWINAIMGEFGLVIIDGNEPALKNRIADIIKDEITNQTSTSIINESIADLEKRYRVQAHPRDINLFYIGNDYRERLVKEGNSISVLNKELSFTGESIKKEIDESIGKFSPNVLLRPLYQESILPDIAYVGGPAEVAYWLELKNVFKHYNVPMPVVMLRNCACVLDKNILDKIKKYSISDKEIFLPADEWIRKFVSTIEEDELPLENISMKITGELDALGLRISKIDPSLNAFMEAEKQKIKTSFLTLKEKVIRSQKKKNETEVNQLYKLKEKLFPGGKLQEREETLIQYYLKWGKSFIEAVKENFDPFNKEFLLLKEKDK